MKRFLMISVMVLLSIFIVACGEVSSNDTDDESDNNLTKLDSSITDEDAAKIEEKLNGVTDDFSDTTAGLYTSGKENDYDQIEVEIKSSVEELEDAVKRGTANGIGNQILDVFDYYTDGDVIPEITLKYEDGTTMAEYSEGGDNEGFEIVN